MPLIDLVLSFRLFQAGVFLLGGLYYLVTLFFHAPAISQRRRRHFTRSGGLLWLCFGIDAIVSWKIGGPTSYLEDGGSYGPIYVVLLARAGSLVFALAYIWASWRSWSQPSQADDASSAFGKDV